MTGGVVVSVAMFSMRDWLPGLEKPGGGGPIPPDHINVPGGPGGDPKNTKWALLIDVQLFFVLF